MARTPAIYTHVRCNTGDVVSSPITNSEVLSALAACAIPCCCGHLWFLHDLVCFEVCLHIGIGSLPPGRHACMLEWSVAKRDDSQALLHLHKYCQNLPQADGTCGIA